MDIIQYSANFLIFPVGLLFALVLLQGSWAGKFANFLASLFESRGLFQTSEKAGDQVALNLSRILLALVLLHRLFNISVFAIPLGLSDVQLLALYSYLLLLLLLLIGLATPLVALFLLIFQLQFNFVLGTYTLGVDVTAMLLLCFILYPVGQKFSLDSLFVEKSRVISGLYRWFTFSDRVTQVTLAKAIPFLSYCLLCLFSVLKHLDEPLWLNGDAAIHLLSSSYLSRYSEFFQLLFSKSMLAVWVAKASMVIMVAWYFLLLPAVLIGGLVRISVIVWAILFFILSAAVLQLSTLPYIEFLILFVWFWDQYRVTEERSVNMLYDDRCNLCDRTVRMVRVLDIQNVVNYLPVSKNRHESERLGVSPELLTRDLYSWEAGSGRVFSGYDFYLYLSTKVLLLMPLYPFLLFFKLIRIGPLMYRKVADYRIKLFGVCALPTDTDSSVKDKFDENQGAAIRYGFFSPLVITNLLFAIVLLAVMPISPLAEHLSKNTPSLIRSAHIFSWSRIDVFNRSDLGMSHHYFTVHVQNNGSQTILPFVDKSGGRLDWHKSDVAYFGNSLSWRRRKNKEEMLPASKWDMRVFCNIVSWANAMGFDNDGQFTFDFYESEWPVQVGGVYNFFAPRHAGQKVVNSWECQN